MERNRAHVRFEFVSRCLSAIRKTQQILVIERGRVVERDTHDELIAKKGRCYDLYTYRARI